MTNSKRKSTLIVLSFIAGILLSGCTAKLAPETQIPPEHQVEKINQNLSIETQRKIQKEYFRYQNNLVTGLFTAAENAIERSNYNKSLTVENTNMQKEKVYECKISQKFGEYEKPFYHNVYLVSNLREAIKPISIAINKNDVEQYMVYPGFGVYEHKDGGYGIAIVDHEKSELSNVIEIRYRCNKIKNTLFKEDNYMPSYDED